MIIIIVEESEKMKIEKEKDNTKKRETKISQKAITIENVEK